MGSAVSSLLGIGLILLAPSVNFIFLFSVIPCFLDLLLILSSLSGEDNLHILLGSAASRKVCLLRKYGTGLGCLFAIHLGLALCMGLLALASGHPLPVLAIYLVIYFLFNVRKPIFVDEIDEHIEKSARATALSVSSQLKSLSLMVLTAQKRFQEKMETCRLMEYCRDLGY